MHRFKNSQVFNLSANLSLLVISLVSSSSSKKQRKKKQIYTGRTLKQIVLNLKLLSAFAKSFPNDSSKLFDLLSLNRGGGGYGNTQAKQNIARRKDTKHSRKVIKRKIHLQLRQTLNDAIVICDHYGSSYKTLPLPEYSLQAEKTVSNTSNIFKYTMTNNTPYAMLSVNNIMDNFCLLLLIPAQNFNKSFINSVKQF